MKLFFDSLWRALISGLHPGVLVLSALPLLVMGAVSAVLFFFLWDTAVQGVQAWLAGWSWLEPVSRWLDGAEPGAWRSAFAQLLVALLALPVLLVLALLSVSWFLTPLLVRRVAQRRFAGLQHRAGSSFWRGLLLTLWWSALALGALLLSLPLWLVPPFILVLPPLIWGWLNYRVMTHDVLAEHADAQESRRIVQRHRWQLLAMGVLTGYLGAAPGLLWALSVMTVVLAPVLVPLSIWVYALVFVFTALWFSHFCLSALQQLRDERLPGQMPAGSIEQSTGLIP